MLWEDIANDVSLLVHLLNVTDLFSQQIRKDTSVMLLNMRSTIDGQGFSYFTTTFRSEMKSKFFQ